MSHLPITAKQQKMIDKVNRARLVHAYVERCASTFKAKSHLLLSTSLTACSVALAEKEGA